jgi:succinate dehydrogenase / fumarate reductase membrane anchor subunit
MSRQASGFKAWVIQRVTAVYIALFVLYAVVHFAVDAPVDVAAWRAWMASPVVSMALLLFFAALLMHAWIGIRDVLIDYVHPLSIRVVVLSAFATALIGTGLWVAQVIFLVRVAG